MLTKVKRKFQELIDWEAKLTHKAGLKPNVVSALGLFLGFLSGLIYWTAGASSTDLNMYKVHLTIAFLLLLFSGFCDVLDGALARIYGGTSVFGGFLDSLVDRYVDSSVLTGLILGGLCDLTWGILALIGSLLTSYARARAESSSVSVESIGIVERAERIIIILIATLIEIAWPSLSAL
ncbi:MAG: CDP-alcohol phosphatidyltransferase family protein, partial [Thermoproteota archaeon]